MPPALKFFAAGVDIFFKLCYTDSTKRREKEEYLFHGHAERRRTVQAAGHGKGEVALERCERKGEYPR